MSAGKTPVAWSSPAGVLSAALAALVFVLGLLTVSPQIHAWLHGKADVPARASSPVPLAADGADDDSGCAVHLYARGITAGVVLLTVFPAIFSRIEAHVPVEKSCWFSPPRYLLRPERGPPATA
jgi:hypothetical protein